MQDHVTSKAPVHDVVLCLESQEGIEICTHDNKRITLRSSKTLNGLPAVVILPRVRYLVRVTPVHPSNFPSPALDLFNQGLLVLPVETPADSGNRSLISHVIVLNLSDRETRLVHGHVLLSGKAYYKQSTDVEDRSDSESSGAFLEVPPCPAAVAPP